MIDAVRPFAGGVAGMLLASAGAVMPDAPSFGPALIVVLGYDLPILPALIGVVGIVATREFAPIAAVEMRLSARARYALTAMMVLAMLCLVISGERRPLVIVGLAGGIGYSGVALFELLAAAVVRGAGWAVDIFSRGVSAKIQSKGPEEGDQ
ncbi:MAG: hypothetical protein AB7E60_01710 [Sphingobium sp.]